MPPIFEHALTVGPEDIDVLGHANNLAYLRWMVSAAFRHAEAQGWSQQDHLRLGSGWVVREHRIRYLRPALPGNQVVVRTWVAATRRATSLRRYRFLRSVDQTELAVAETQWAYINFQTGTPTRIPAEVAQAFELVEQGVGF